MTTAEAITIEAASVLVTEILASNPTTKHLSYALTFGTDSDFAENIDDIAGMATDAFEDIYGYTVSDPEAFKQAILDSFSINGYDDSKAGLEELRGASDWCLLDLADYALQAFDGTIEHCGG